MNSLSSIEILEPDSLSDTIDFSRPFMPEKLTPFFFTPIYQTLTDAQRLRYNQLNALYFNEQTMFFEKTLAQNVLGYFLSQSLPEELKDGLRQFLAEEKAHTEMFRQLNRSCAPEFYSRQDFHFIQVPPLAAKILEVVSKHPRQFPFLLWLMHLQEERAMFFGKVFLKHAGLLEPHFVETQRKHLADEIGHVRWDESLLDWIWPKTTAWSRRINSQIFSWMVKEYFTTPKRTAPRIINALVKEFPELQPQRREFCRQLHALENDATYRRSLYSPENVPMTFKRFDAWPEFQMMTGAMPSYNRGGNS
ncbi:MAG TPA: diiron oxygenase [Verrucomicrobiae bacterium]|nr:diiron oxygenase [Verrucomicrobiae bacterium]